LIGLYSPLSSQSTIFKYRFFALGWCGNDEIAKALTLIASGAGESFCLLFAEKSKSHCPAGGQKSLCWGYFANNNDLIIEIRLIL
jgi:hypothetical protein